MRPDGPKIAALVVTGIMVAPALEENEIELYIGHWGAQSGTMWIDILSNRARGV